ncbi:ZIP family metal transporter, partial [Patescibacteria group bacterium]|nr:ZIP family metal transporter [Patescibacteria group bacterium]
MTVFSHILISSFLISLAALVGIFSLSKRKEFLQKIVFSLVSLSAGTLMGGAFLHLIPEALERLRPESVFGIVLISFSSFYLIEKIFHWRHCHEPKCQIHTFGYMNLVGDSIHNFIDGLIIAAAFLTNIPLGISTTVAIAMHEIPQEMGDFGVLIYSGFEKNRALFLNFLVALTTILGGIVGYFLAVRVGPLRIYLLAFAAGGFLYVSASDLIPEIRKETELKKSLISFVFFLIGLAIIYFIKDIA